MAAPRTSRFIKHAIITGRPGIGKTTLIKKIRDKLSENGVTMKGFYTEEIRNDEEIREGFDVVTLDGQSAPLAIVSPKKKAPGTADYHRGVFIVGKYTVNIQPFESLVLPILKEKITCPTVYIIDEIGKMELYSREFGESVVRVFDQRLAKVICTVPIQRTGRMATINHLYSRRDALIYEVNEENRDDLVDEISESILPNLTK